MNKKGTLISSSKDHEVSVGFEEQSIWQSWRETIVLTLSFMAAYTAYLAIQSLQSSLNQEAGLGVVSLACLYGTIILSGVVTPIFLRFVGAKKTLIIAWVCHLIYTGSNFYPTWGTLIPSSVILGGIAAPMWTAQGLYITANGERIAKTSHDSLHAILSKLNGVFFMCYESTQITGNLISSLVLTQGNYADSNSTLICGADDCPTAANATQIAEPESHIVYILLGVFLVCDVIALLLTVFLLPPLQKDVSVTDSELEGPSPGLGRILVSWCTALSDPKLIGLVIFFVSTSMGQGILFADYTKSFISCALGISMVGYIMASHGAITSLVATVSSRVAKYSGRYVLFGFALLCNVSMTLTLLLWKPEQKNVAPFFIVPLIWGLAIGIFHTQINSLVGLMFPEKKEAAFANYHTWNAIGYTITFAYGGVLCVRTKLFICIGTVTLGIIGYIAAEAIYAKENRKTTETINGSDEDKRMLQKGRKTNISYS